MEKFIKDLFKIVGIIFGVLSIGGIIAGYLDRKGKKNTAHKPYGVFEEYFKRPMDFILSSFALIVLGPIVLIIAILVRFKLGTPILFTQERPGKGERLFKLYKFRTMTDERDSEGELLTDSKRITRFGNALRATSMDELPELWNIVKGDMGLVGPRPLLTSYLPYYSYEERKRHDVRPGLSGLAQINGRNFIKWDDRLAFDVQYIKKITFRGDVKIIAATVMKVIRRDDVATNTEIIETYLDQERSM